MPKTATDWLMEAVALLLLVGLFMVPLLLGPDLPDRIPTHFGASGKADAWGSKSSLYVLPAIGMGLYIILTACAFGRMPINVPWSFEDTPAVRARLAVIMRVLKIMMMVTFAYILLTTVQVAQGKAAGLGSAFLPVLLLSHIGGVFVMMYWATKMANR